MKRYLKDAMWIFALLGAMQFWYFLNGLNIYWEKQVIFFTMTTNIIALFYAFVMMQRFDNDTFQETFLELCRKFGILPKKIYHEPKRKFLKTINDG